jgi:hypothetical protein
VHGAESAAAAKKFKMKYLFCVCRERREREINRRYDFF